MTLNLMLKLGVFSVLKASSWNASKIASQKTGILNISDSESSYVELSQIIAGIIQLDFRRSAGLRYRNKIQLAYI